MAYDKKGGKPSNDMPPASIPMNDAACPACAATMNVGPGHTTGMAFAKLHGFNYQGVMKTKTPAK